MLNKIDKTCSIFFGDAASFPVSHKDPAFEASCEQLQKQLALDTLVFNHQVHGIKGHHVASNQPHGTVYKQHEGDWLTTSSPNIGIGVLTADCLPIVFYEPKSKLVAVAHAGWKGSAQNISHTVLDALKKHTPHTPKIFFGPSAHSCCYEVKEDFIEQVKQTAHGMDCVIKRDDKMFFDNVRFNTLQLADLGITPDAIDITHSMCTICNHQFHSYRRAEDKKLYKTQGTIVWLNQ